ncbi:helix-turn-helix transcriptional regulator [Saccharopolyspora sp. HNM0986]|uniref:helix-turn-helix domain-containing protein n=1 Tax=Saccharopolyspora galaxeae TaxID=2781241 RepID=UPI001F414962|nr:Scr1 family TA system antitoxin-like transcriptional regulator [Saccharopolyspora sp. HNM0986]MBK0869219.1 helix-turn-helix transcriptional regulator [Saccharopolyspora sp. HNM0986]
MNGTTPRPRAYVLGAEMRDARQKSGLALRRLAAILDVSHSVLVRWERGDRVPSAESVSAVCAVLGSSATARNRMLKLAREAAAEPPPSTPIGVPGQSDQLATLLEFERTATRITDVATNVVPGLLQAPEYARAIIHAGEAENADKRVALRLGRREIITRRRSPVHYRALILETALHQPIGDPGTLLEQLRLLLELGAQDTVEIRVIPNSAGWTPAHSGDFFLLEFSKAAPVVHLEHHRGSVFLQSESDVAAFVRARDEVERVAMSCADSAELITGIIARARAA